MSREDRRWEQNYILKPNASRGYLKGDARARVKDGERKVGERSVNDVMQDRQGRRGEREKMLQKSRQVY